MYAQNQGSVCDDLLEFLFRDRERWLAVIAMNAFLDESGTNAGSPVVSVAGFYGSKEQWKEFVHLWSPYADGFHAKHSDRLFSQLCDAIEASKINGVFITLAKETYDSVSSAQMKSRLGNAYAMCVFQCVLSICREAEKPVAFILEKGQPNLEFVYRHLSYMADSGEFRIASISEARRGYGAIELHPADFVSHCASTFDDSWLRRLMSAHRLKHGRLEEQNFAGVSKELARLINKARRERRKHKESK